MTCLASPTLPFPFLFTKTDTHTDMLCFSERLLKWRSDAGVHGSASCRIVIKDALWDNAENLSPYYADNM